MRYGSIYLVVRDFEKSLNYNENGKLMRSASRELSDNERKENGDIL